jgi:hypothetical protein
MWELTLNGRSSTKLALDGDVPAPLPRDALALGD